MKHYYLILLVLLCGCIRSELPSSEADIVAFSLPDVRLMENNINADFVYIMVSSRDESRLNNIVPKFTLSKGASIMQADNTSADSAVNLNNAEYIVTAENGVSTKKYTISIAREYDSDTVRFNFNDWKTTSDGYYKLSDDNWSSGNAGITIALGMLGREKTPLNYPTQMSTEGKDGNAAKLVTTQGGKPLGMNVAVWAGSFFLGNFNTANVITPLRATEFGRTYKRRPRCMRGWYKYSEGTGAYIRSYSNNSERTDTIPAQRDSCAIYAVFYLSDGSTLDATTIDNHPSIIARADIANSAGGGAATAGDGWHEFNLEFRYRDNDFVMDSMRQYKLAIVFSSSARGGTSKPNEPSVVVYAGKVGSTLIVDEVEVVND